MLICSPTHGHESCGVKCKETDANVTKKKETNICEVEDITCPDGQKCETPGKCLKPFNTCIEFPHFCSQFSSQPPSVKLASLKSPQLTGNRKLAVLYALAEKGILKVEDMDNESEKYRAGTVDGPMRF